MEKSKALEMIAAISNANGVSGFEDEAVSEILTYAQHVGKTNVDRMRNTYIHRNGNTGAARFRFGVSAAQASVSPPPCEPPVAPTRAGSTSSIAMTIRASCAVSRKTLRKYSLSGSSSARPRMMWPWQVLPRTGMMSSDVPP